LSLIHILQQQLDFLEGLEETPTKGKGKGKGKGKQKGQPLKSGTSSDSDAYDGSTHHGAGDDTDDSTDSMDVDGELPEAPALPTKQPRNYSAPFPNVQPGSTLPPHGGQGCGLCGRIHGPGACSMVGSSSNLMEYREILLNHSDNEPWEYRVRIYPISCERHVEETRTDRKPQSRP
jgi:chromodomain-helicase-DNA-binding protein 4